MGNAHQDLENNYHRHNSNKNKNYNQFYNRIFNYQGLDIINKSITLVTSKNYYDFIMNCFLDQFSAGLIYH